MEALLTVSDESSAKRLRLLGWGLIGAAFLLPFIALYAGLGSAFEVGADIARTMGSLLFLELVAWLVTRKKNALSKSRGTAIVGALLCIVVGNNIYQANRERQTAMGFVDDALRLQEKAGAKFVEFGGRFDKVDLTTVLTPETMTTAAGMARAKGTLAEYRALLAERRALLQTDLAEMDQFFAAVADGQMKQVALAHALAIA